MPNNSRRPQNAGRPGCGAGTDRRCTVPHMGGGRRGGGGYLLNGKGERFMGEYDPRNERATRDIVSRGMYDQMLRGNVGPNGGVYITMRHLDPVMVKKEFPGMVERCADCGFDLAGGRVEVVPTAHYMMGGVVFAPDTSTPLPALFAAGEDTGGVHGANRLGGHGVAKPPTPGLRGARPAERDHGLAQRPVVTVNHSLPAEAPCVDAQGIAVVNVVVDQRGQQVVRQCNGLKVAGEMQVDVFHRHHLSAPAASGSALHAKHRAQRRLAQADDGALTDAVERITEPHCGGGLALAGRCGVDTGHQHQSAIGSVL